MNSSLSYWKREKNFRAQDKGYVRDPEGFPLKFLVKRLKQEMKELDDATWGYYSQDFSSIGEKQVEKIVKECADVSNMIDYIHSKVINHTLDKYIPTEDGG